MTRSLPASGALLGVLASLLLSGATAVDTAAGTAVRVVELDVRARIPDADEPVRSPTELDVVAAALAPVVPGDPRGTIERAVDRVVPVAARAGLLERPVDGSNLVTVLERLGLVDDDGVRLDALALAVSASTEELRPLFAASDVEVGDEATGEHLAAVVRRAGRRGAVTNASVDAARAAARTRLAVLVERAEVGDVDPLSVSGLTAVLTALGVDVGPRLDPDDVATGEEHLRRLDAEEEAARRAAEEQATAVTTAQPASSGPVDDPGEGAHAPTPPVDVTVAEPSAPAVPVAEVPVPDVVEPDVEPSPAAEPPLPPPPPPPPPPPVSPWTELHGSLETRTLSLPGPIAAHVLRWRLGDPAVRVRVDDAGSPGRRASVQEAAVRRGAVAAVNGGFWVDDDDPDGWFVRDGVLRSDTTLGRFTRRDRRGGFGLAADGRAVVGVPSWGAGVTIGGMRRQVWGLNRRPVTNGDVVLFTSGVWTTPPVSGGVQLRVPRPGRLDEARDVVLPILERSREGLALDDDTLVVWLDDEAAAGLDLDQDELRLDVRVDPAWAGLDQGLAAGPWILDGGKPTGERQWRHEGFDADHTNAPHPRTVFGLTGDGRGVVVVVDGRQPGHSVGMSVPEVTAMLTDLGVRDAVMLDGGGSSQLVLNGRMTNRPCCDASPRRVATVLLFERG